MNDGSSQNQHNDLVATSGYNNHSRYASAADPTPDSNRISYQPHSQRTSASDTPSYPAYDYGRNSSSSVLAGAASTMASSYNATTATANQWSGSQGQNRSSRSGAYNSMDPYHAGSGVGNNDASASLQSFNMRNQTHDRSGSGADALKQPQSYSHYPAHSSQQQQQQHQATSAQQPMNGSNWYGFSGGSNGSFPPGGSNSDYNYGSWAS